MKRYIATLLLLAICASTQAREVFPLNEGWRFFFKSENSSDNARHVTLPHTWNTDTGGTGYFLETTANYQNDMYIPAEWATKRLFVKFYGVQSVADVFVNGYYVGGHKGGGTAFALEITDKIRFGSDNALLVVVSNNYCDDVLPTSTDMNLYGGIYREAELILTEKTAVSPLYLGSDGILVHQNSVGDERVEGEAEIHLVTGGENSCVLTLDITAPDGSRVFSKRQKTRIDGKPVTIPFSVDAPQLWSPANPALYRVSVSIGDATVTDSVAVRTGFRSIVATPAGGFAVNGSRIPEAEELIAKLCKIPGMTSISLNINREKTNVILGRKGKLLWGKEYITDTIGPIAYQISPQSFYQVNPVQTQKLYEKALEYAGLEGNETVWDLYCGIGTISLFLAQKAKQVYGVEIVPAAIEDAKRNATLNHITNAEFFVGKAEEVLPEKYEKEGIYADVIVVDPPRKGCEESVLATMVKMQPKRIVYVSCDSATLARDLKYLRGEGYEVKKVQGVDQFPHTVHVETVVLLSKGEVDSKKIRVEFSLEDMDMSEFQDGATYTQIKDYVLEHSGLKVSNLYISQIKRKCGIEVGKNYNLPKSEDSRQPMCPPEKEKAIREAFKYFGMI